MYNVYIYIYTHNRICLLAITLIRRAKVSDCSPANRERELGLDRRETG